MSLFERFRDWLVERDLRRRPLEVPEHSEPGGGSSREEDDAARFLLGSAPERMSGDIDAPPRH